VSAEPLPPELDPAEVAALLGPPAAPVATLPAGPPPGLRRVATQAAHRLGEALGRCLGAPVTARVAWVACGEPAELSESLPDPMCAFLWRARGAAAAAIDPRTGRDGVTAVCEIGADLARRCIAALLGASAPSGSAPPTWEPTPSEWDILRVPSAALADELADVLGHATEVHGHATRPHLLADWPGPVTACGFEVMGPGFTGLVHLLWPARD